MEKAKGSRMNQPASNVEARIRAKVINSLRTRRDQKREKRNLPLSCSHKRMAVIKYPEMTKKTSTPAKPVGRKNWRHVTQN